MDPHVLRARLCTPALSLFVIVASASAQTAPNPPLTYPAAPRGTQVDVYHGVSIADPFRPLEEVDAPATKAWVDAENRLTDSFLATIPERVAIHNRLTKLWNYARFSVPFKEKDRYFYFQNTGLQNQSVLYVQDGRDGRQRVLLDPNVLSADGTVALGSTAVSDDARLLAYSLSTSGSDWQEIHVRDVDTGRDLPDVLKWVKFSSTAWTHDNRGFFYSRYDEPTSGNKMTNANKNHKLYYHRIGQPQSRDELVYDRSDQPDWLFNATVSDDGQYLIINVSQGTDVRTRLYFIDLDDAGKPKIDNPVVRLIDRLDAEYDFVGNRGTIFYVRTDKNAPRGRVVGISLDNPREERWTTLIPESKDALISATKSPPIICRTRIRRCGSTAGAVTRVATIVLAVSRSSGLATRAASTTTPARRRSLRASAFHQSADLRCVASCRCLASVVSTSFRANRATMKCSTASRRSSI